MESPESTPDPQHDDRGGFRQRVTMQYTEEVYYDADGVEIARNRIYDDSTYDIGPMEPMSADELADQR